MYLHNKVLYMLQLIKLKLKIKVITGLPHTQGTQGIQGNSGNFQVEENLRETQGDSGNLREF